MTDNEIIKALKLCMSEHMGCEDGCPYDTKKLTYSQCKLELSKDSIDLINRQRAEIERLRCSAIRNGKQIGSLIHHLEQSKSEAYREFAERLHQKCAVERGFAVMADDAIERTYKELTEKNDKE